MKIIDAIPPKAFCSECCYYEASVVGWSDRCRCNKNAEDTWYERNGTHELPSEKNRNNDCPDFEVRVLWRTRFLKWINSWR